MHRGVPLATHRLRGFLVHANRFYGWDNFKIAYLASRRMVPKFGLEHLLLADKQHLHIVVSGCQNRTLDFRFGCAVRAHCIDGDNGGHVELSPACNIFVALRGSRFRLTPASWCRTALLRSPQCHDFPGSALNTCGTDIAPLRVLLTRFFRLQDLAVVIITTP
jgi:hypothetical protein